MSASSKPTRIPRSRRPRARLSAVVDFPTPPLPEATAMTAAMPGISDCFDIGDTGLCGGRGGETLGTPRRVGMLRRRRGGTGFAFGRQRDHGDGDAGNGAHRRFSLVANAFPGAGLG